MSTRGRKDKQETPHLTWALSTVSNDLWGSSGIWSQFFYIFICVCANIQQLKCHKKKRSTWAFSWSDTSVLKVTWCLGSLFIWWFPGLRCEILLLFLVCMLQWIKQFWVQDCWSCLTTLKKIIKATLFKAALTDILASWDTVETSCKHPTAAWSCRDARLMFY